MDNENYQKLRDYALRLLSFRPRSTKEISNKLKKFCAKRNFPDKYVDQVIEELKQQKFLDDREFVRWWIEQRQQHRPKGAKAIKLELLQKGIDKEIISSTAEGMRNDSINEYDLAMKVVNKKLNLFKNLSREKFKIKVRDLLLRRGFDWDTIHKVIDSLTKKE